MRPQLEYASTVWFPHTATDITKLEAVQRRSARWAIRDYQRTCSVTQMIKDLNWRTLERRRVDSRLTLMHKITCDLVAIPAADYLFLNTRQSRYNHLLAYRQIPTLKDYYKYTFFPRTIVHWRYIFYSTKPPLPLHLYTEPRLMSSKGVKTSRKKERISLIRDFAVRMKKAWVLSYPLCGQRRLWSDWVDAQADLSLR